MNLISMLSLDLKKIIILIYYYYLYFISFFYYLIYYYHYYKNYYIIASLIHSIIKAYYNPIATFYSITHNLSIKEAIINQLIDDLESFLQN